jgi:hypothetical protein
MQLGYAPTSDVMAGLVPAIHAAPLQETFEVGGLRSAWMPGTSPGTTRQGCKRLELWVCKRWSTTTEFVPSNGALALQLKCKMLSSTAFINLRQQRSRRGRVPATGLIHHGDVVPLSSGAI